MSEVLGVLVRCADLPWRPVRRVAAAGLLLALMTHPTAVAGPVVDFAAHRAEAVSRVVVDAVVGRLRTVAPSPVIVEPAPATPDR